MTKIGKKTMLVVGVIIVVAILFLVPGGIDDGSAYQIDFQTFDFTSPNITCFIKATLLADGRIVDQSSFIGGSSGTAPTLSLVNRFTGEKINDFEVQLKGRCDDRFSVGGDINKWTLLPSTVTLFVSSNNLDGQAINLQTQQKLTNEINLIDNTEATFTTWKFKASDLDSRYSPYIEEYRAQVKIDILGDFKFQHKGVTSNIWTIKSSFGDIVTSFNYNVQKIIKTDPTPIKANKLIEIQSVQKTIGLVDLTNAKNKLDTSKTSGRQIKITGLVRDWDIGDGNPTVKITHSGKTVQSLTLSLERRITTSVANDAIFVGFKTMDQNSSEGEYLVVMTMAGRTNPSTRSFWVDNLDTTPTGTTTGTGSPTPVSMETEKLLKQPAKTKFFYDITFKDGSTSAKLLDESTPIFLQGLDLTSTLGDSNSQKPIKSITLSLLLAFDSEEDLSRFSTQSSQVQFSPELSIDGKKVQLTKRPQQGFAPTSSKCIRADGETTCANTTLPLGTVVISANTIEEQIRQNTDSEFANVQIKVTGTGTFTVKDQTGKQFEGNAGNAVFTWNVNYAKNGDSAGERPECPEGSFLKALSGGGFKCIDNETNEEVEPKKNPCDTGFDFIDGICQLFQPKGTSETPETETPDTTEDPEISGDPETPKGTDGQACFVFGQNVCAFASTVGGDSVDLSGIDSTIIVLAVVFIVIGIVLLAVRGRNKPQLGFVPGRY